MIFELEYPSQLCADSNFPQDLRAGDVKYSRPACKGAASHPGCALFGSSRDDGRIGISKPCLCAPKLYARSVSRWCDRMRPNENLKGTASRPGCTDPPMSAHSRGSCRVWSSTSCPSGRARPLVHFGTPFTWIVPQRKLHLRPRWACSHAALPPISAHPSHGSRPLEAPLMAPVGVLA